MKTLKLILAFLFAASLITTTASAATCGYSTHAGNVSSDVLKLGEAHSLILTSSNNILIFDDHENPQHLAKGECKGMGILKDGGENWSGACLYKDTDGDQWAVTWEHAGKPGEAAKGVYKSSPSDNTGKYAGNTTSGTYTMMPGIGSRWCAD